MSVYLVERVDENSAVICAAKHRVVITHCIGTVMSQVPCSEGRRHTGHASRYSGIQRQDGADTISQYFSEKLRNTSSLLYEE